MPVMPAGPPPVPQFPQPVAAPRSRGGFLLGIVCGVILAVAALVVLGQKLAEKKAEDAPSDQPAPITATTDPGSGTAPAPAPDAGTPSGNFVKVWADHNVQRDGRTGMLIHAHFIIQGARQDTCQIAAYFYYANGEILKDFDQDYRASDGQASVGEEFTPEYDSTEFEDYTLFMPYDELHMEAGNHELKFDLQVHHQPSGKVAVQSEYTSFTLNQA